MKFIVALIIILTCFSALESTAQRSRKKSKNSYAKGTLYGYWGYNRSAYTKSDINFVGSNYDFTLKGASASDNPEEVNLLIYLNPSKLTIPQFNARIGYYFWNNFALSLGYDHMKYLLDDRNNVLLDGTIAPGVDDKWSGTYNDLPVVTDRNHIHYENSDGLNYVRVGLTRTDQWYKTRNKNGWFAFSTQLSVATGFLLSFNDFQFGGEKTTRTISASGFGVSGHVGARFEFFNHLFLQTQVSGGFHNQTKVRNRPDDVYAITKHKYGYTALETVLGFFLYIRPTNGCDTCPHW